MDINFIKVLSNHLSRETMSQRQCVGFSVYVYVAERVVAILCKANTSAMWRRRERMNGKKIHKNVSAKCENVTCRRYHVGSECERQTQKRVCINIAMFSISLSLSVQMTANYYYYRSEQDTHKMQREKNTNSLFRDEKQKNFQHRKTSHDDATSTNNNNKH